MNRTRYITLIGLLAALALALSFVEGLIPTAGLLPPGVKLGLSNIITMFAAFSLGFPAAAGVALIKAAFALLTRGGMAGLLSLVGGMLSAGVISFEVLLDKKRKMGFLGVSISGALFHNFGQLTAVTLITSAAALAYAPVLLISAVISGTVTALLLKALWPYISKLETKVRTHKGGLLR